MQGYSIFVCIFRGQDEEDQFTEIVRNMVSVTDLTVPAKKKVYGKNNGVSRNDFLFHERMAKRRKS